MTAVEFIKEKLMCDEYWYENMTFEQIFEQAKEMEKEQIVTAHYQGYRNDIGTTEVSEQYYNKTFKSE